MDRTLEFDRRQLEISDAMRPAGRVEATAYYLSRGLQSVDVNSETWTTVPLATPTLSIKLFWFTPPWKGDQEPRWHTIVKFDAPCWRVYSSFDDYNPRDYFYSAGDVMITNPQCSVAFADAGIGWDHPKCQKPVVHE